MKKVALSLLVLVLAAGLAGLGVLWSGTLSVAADEPHSRTLHRLLELGRERSVAVRAARVRVPALDRPELVSQGAGNYAAMCEGCHLRPGVGDSELRRGLYPQPPALAMRTASDPARDFWIIKHGLKATGMPAWGRSMEDEAIWGMVAFLRTLPAQSREGYTTAVAASSGHSHGDGSDAPSPSAGHEDAREEPGGEKPVAADHEGDDHHAHEH
ncbi:MAG: cytochrome c [Chromatiales bacterium]|nr:cytochrome c [Chromatiales bacterium]